MRQQSEADTCVGVRTLASVGTLLRGGLLAALTAVAAPVAAQAPGQPSAVIDFGCDRDCLIGFSRSYVDALEHRDPTRVALARNVRFTENNVEMPFPDGTWDTVSAEPGPPLTFSDPQTGNVAVFTTIMQDEIEGFLAVRLHVDADRRIDEVEHIISTRRNLSSPPTPIGNVREHAHAPIIDQTVPEAERASREALAAHAHGYFDTLQRNDGEIRGTCFHDDATRRENGLLFTDIGGGFETGRYFFNNRVRREIVLVDEGDGPQCTELEGRSLVVDELHVAGHGDDHLAQRLCLGRLAVGDLVELGHPVDEHGDLVAEVRPQGLQPVLGVFDGVVQDPGDNRVSIQAVFGQ